MRTSAPAHDNRPAHAPARNWPRTRALWALQLLLAFLFAGGGAAKIGGDPAMVDMFATIGVGQWFRFLVGTLEIAGAVGLLIPRLAGLAALGLSAVLVGAIAANLLILQANPWTPLAMLVASAVIAAVRWPQTSQTVTRIGGR